MISRLPLREVDPTTCALKNVVSASRLEGVYVTHLQAGETHVALNAKWADLDKRVLIPLQQLVDFWLGDTSLPAEQIERDIALRFVQDMFRVQGLPSQETALQWHSVAGFASEQDACAPMIRLPGEPFDMYLDQFPQALRAPGRLWPDLPVDTRWVLDTATLQTRELAGLAPGDVICVARQQGTIYAGEAALFSFHVQDDFLMLDDLQAYSDAQGDGATDANETASHLRLDTLPVTVSFVLRKRTMTVADIGSLHPGMTMSLDDMTPYVDIVAGGVVLAHGELVRVGEKLGVEINKITPVIGGESDSSP